MPTGSYAVEGLALAMTGITRDFPGVRALDGADLHVRAGEIHGIVGENGAGKSTLIKILGGVYDRNSGDIAIGGEALSAPSPRDMWRRGVRVIHQELHLAGHFTVAEAVFLGQERVGRFGLDKAAMVRASQAFLRDVLHVEIDGRRLIRDLGVAERKLVQVAAALIDGNARIVVFDEPTAPLSAGEAQHLFAAILRLKERGISIVYVSHYLNEVVAICDRVTVLRNGRSVAVLDRPGPEQVPELIALMIGRPSGDLFPVRHAVSGAPALTVTALGDGRSFADVSLTIRQGEIVGIAGLIGSGREELVDALYGLRRRTTGAVHRRRAPLAADPARAVRSGVVLVPRDRRHDGLVLDMSVAGNINLASLREVSTAGFWSRRRAAARAKAQVGTLDIRPRMIRLPVRLLSGGNQQKVVLARWLAARAGVFLLDEPTMGVDIGARAEIYRIIAALADSGAAILVSSSDVGELLGICDRISIMVRGRPVDEVAAKALTLDTLIAAMTGGSLLGKPA